MYYVITTPHIMIMGLFLYIIQLVGISQAAGDKIKYINTKIYFGSCKLVLSSDIYFC